jgi:hypothetical protein
LGKRESVNALKKMDFDEFREKEEYKHSIFQMEEIGPLERTEGSAPRPSSR